MSCTGPCRQGRDPCPTPEACHEPLFSDEVPGWRILARAAALVMFAATAGFLLAGCGENARDTAKTANDGYAMRCIDGTRYILISTVNGLAITPHLGTDGLPKGCAQ